MASKRKSTKDGRPRKSARLAAHVDGPKDLKIPTAVSQAGDVESPRETAWLNAFLEPMPSLWMPSPNTHSFRDFSSLLQTQYHDFRPFAIACQPGAGTQERAHEVALTLYRFQTTMEDAEQKIFSGFNDPKERVERFGDSTIASSDTWYAGGDLTGESTRA